MSDNMQPTDEILDDESLEQALRVLTGLTEGRG